MRPAIEHIKERKGLIGAEIGVWRGDNALDMLTNLDLKKLYLVDPYVPYQEGGNYFMNANGEALETKDRAIKLLENFKKKIVWLFTTSMEAVKQVEDNSLDFVYIDGNHQYEYIRDDIREWTNKVKEGGLMSGHDANVREVNIAVLEYCKENGYKSSTFEYKKDKNFWRTIADSAIGRKISAEEAKQLVGKDELVIPKDWWFIKEKVC